MENNQYEKELESAKSLQIGFNGVLKTLEQYITAMEDNKSKEEVKELEDLFLFKLERMGGK